MRFMLLAATGITRKFVHVPYGEPAPPGPSISCDGKVKGSSFDATHWTGNETPDDLYADTSTEIALNLARARLDGRYTELDNAVAVNNHWDADGVLSAWACVDPDAALPHAELLAGAAAAGDFGEWPSDAAVKLNIAVNQLYDPAAADEGYADALRRLPAIVADLDAREDLWRDGFVDVLESWELVEDGIAQVSEGAGRIALVIEGAGQRLRPQALHRALADTTLERDCARVLRASFFCGAWKYEYEKVGHGWVARLKDRIPAPPADGEKIAAALGDGWEAGGSGGLIKICRTSSAIDAPPDAVLESLLEADEGARD